MSMNELRRLLPKFFFYPEAGPRINSWAGSGVAPTVKTVGCLIYLLPLAFSITSFATFVGAAMKCENSMVELARPEVMVRN